MSERNIPEESRHAYHERVKALREWTALSPKIDYFIVEGKLVETGHILRSGLEERPDLEVGAKPAPELPNLNETGEERQPISKSDPLPTSPPTVPQRTSKEVSEVTTKIVTSALVRTYSQLNFGVGEGIYSPSEKRFYPEGTKPEEAAPFTLPTDEEIVKVLLADHLKTIKPSDLSSKTRLREDLEMSGTSLTRFQDELEHFGFQRPGLDLAEHATVGEVIEKLSAQTKVMENLRAIVLFPRTKGYFKAQEEFQVARKETVEAEGLPVVRTYAREYFTALTNRQPEGGVTFEQVLGTPVFTCDSESDFQALRPIEKRKVKPNTYIYSYVITRLSRIYPQGEKFNIPLIVRRSGSSDQEVIQHARTQLAFARKVNPEALSPVLTSSVEVDFEGDLRQKVRNYLLSILVSQREVVDWYKDKEGGQGSVKRKQLFPRTQKEVFEKGRPLYMRNWLSERQKLLGRREKDEIFNEVNRQMKEDLGILTGLILVKPSVQWQVFIANYLSFVDDWEGAERTFQSWEYRNVFRDTFGATLPPSTDIFRDRAPQV